MANATIIYACTGDGLAILNKPGTSQAWLPARRVLEGKRALSAWAEPGPPIRVLVAAASSDTGALLLSENGGRTWQTALDAPATAIASVLQSSGGEEEPATRPAGLYAAIEDGRFVASPDGGTTWEILPALEEGGTARLMLADREDPERCYLLLERDGELILLEGHPATGEWRALPVDGVTALSQEAVTGDLYATTAEDVQLSADRGVTWAPLPGSPPEGLSVLALPGPADQPPALVVGVPFGLLVSPDGGGTWQAAELPQPGGVTALAHDPERRDRLYAGTATGYLFESGNRGRTWQQVNAEPLPPVSSLYVLRI